VGLSRHTLSEWRAYASDRRQRDKLADGLAHVEPPVESQPMTTKERLHRLVDELSEREADEALRLIASRREGDFATWLDSVPEEDEEISEDENSAVQEARDEIVAGAPLIAADEIKREFQYSSE
jgi:hypothetical protein